MQWAVALLVVVVIGAPIVVIEWRGMRLLSARAVMRRVERKGRYLAHVGRLSNVWFPEGAVGAEGFLQMPGRGRATYTLDLTDQVVHVHWEPKRGPARDYSGPAPLAATREVRHKLRGTVVAVISVYLVTGAVGAFVGAIEAHPHARPAATLVGLGCGLVVGYFISFWVGGYSYIRVVQEAREKAKQTATPPPHP